MSTIGDRIRSLREFRDLTQEQLADRAGVYLDTIRKARAEPAAVRPHQHPPRARTRPRRPARAPGRTTHRDPATLRTRRRPPRAPRRHPGHRRVLPGVLADDNLEDPPHETPGCRRSRGNHLYWHGEYSELSEPTPATPAGRPRGRPPDASRERSVAATRPRLPARRLPGHTGRAPGLGLHRGGEATRGCTTGIRSADGGHGRLHPLLGAAAAGPLGAGAGHRSAEGGRARAAVPPATASSSPCTGTC
jgi:hypothetical protein